MSFKVVLPFLFSVNLIVFCSPCFSAEITSPHINYVFPAGGQQGTSFEIVIGGINFQGVSDVRITGTGVTAKVNRVEELVDQNKPAEKSDTAKKKQETKEKLYIAYVSVTVDAQAELGQRDLRLVTPHGFSNRFRFLVGQIPEINELEPNSDKSKPQRLQTLPVLVNGQIMPGDRDFFRFSAKAGQTFVCEVKARDLLPYIADAVPGWLQSSLTLYSADGKELEYVDDFRFKPDPVLIYKVPKDEEYVLEIKDAIYRGREDFLYRLSIGSLPYITDIFPLGGRRNTDVQVGLEGVNLFSKNLNLTIPSDSPNLRQVQVSNEGLISNAVPFTVDDLSETQEAESNDSAAGANQVKVPVIINGRIQQPGDVDCFIFVVEADQKFIMDIKARRLGSPLDSIMTISMLKGRQLAENDDTVDSGEGLLTHHADSHLDYTFRARGRCLLKIRDIQGNGGKEYAYRLVITHPQPDFGLYVTPDNLCVGQGGTTAITIHALRRDGFSGEIKLSVGGISDGFVVSDAVIPAGQEKVRFTITAPLGVPIGVISPIIAGTVTFGDQTVNRIAVPAEELMQAFSYEHFVPTKEFLLMIMEPALFSLKPDVKPGEILDITQGSSVEVLVKVNRKEGATGVINLMVDGPAKGITVKRAVIQKDKDESTVMISVGQQITAGYRQNIILTGSMKIGKETHTVMAPSIPIRVVAPK